MARNWTPAQTSAIETRGKTLLVSAAAGSGKTAVLTERIIRLLTDSHDPADLSRMLIVTFTRASAAELRQRISQALGEALAENPGNRHLHRQLLALSAAKISTIHAYCLELIRANFQRLGLPAQFRVADEAEAGVLSRSLMDELISERYADDEAFGMLADHFTGARSDASLADTFLDLYDKLSAYPEGVEYLRTDAERIRGEGTSLRAGWGRIAAEQVSRIYRSAANTFEEACAEMVGEAALEKHYLPAFSADLTHIRTVLDALEGGAYSSLRTAMQDYSPLRLGGLRGDAKTEDSERFKRMRDSFKQDQRDLCEKFFLPDEARLLSFAVQTADAIEGLYAVLAEYDRRLRAEKLRRGICDFSDIERYTLALLVDADGNDTELARELADGFDVICIDEYQDVNAVQDRIFRALSRPRTRFMVGDIKQSIYRFRGAEPAIFADYRRTFPALETDPDAEASSIFMSSNFRCDRPILDFSNRIFSFLFGLCGESIGYLPQDDLVCGKQCPDDSAPVTLALLQDGDTEDDEDSAPEAVYIAKEISKLLHEGKLDNGSPIKPGHIAILMRAKTGLEEIKSALEDRGIPCASGGSDAFFENPEVLMMLCLLNAIDNPNRDVYLVGALRSPLFGFTLDELISVRRAFPQTDVPFYTAFRQYTEQESWEKGERFLARLESYREMAEGTPVDRLLDALYRDTAVMAYAGRQDGDDDRRTPAQKRANLQLLYEYARRFESSSYRGLYNFIRYLDDIIAEGTRIETPGAPEQDAVRILTVHQSKGLEFPVCFLCGSGRRFNLRDASANLLFDHDAGVAIRLRDETGFARRTTPIREAVAARITDVQIEEEMRILYVALTRARERLYITAQLRRGDDGVLDRAEDRRRFASQASLMSCRCYLDWILTALSGTPQDCWRLDCSGQDEPGETEFPGESAEQTIPAAEEPCDAGTPEQLTETLRERFSFVYPDAHLTRLPAKLAVSRLYPGLLDEEDTAEDLRDEHVRLPEMRQKPAFLDAAGRDGAGDAAERGTATHVFLQFCDFSRAAHEGIAAEAERLIAQGFITERMASLLRTEELERFFHGEFYASVSRARWSMRDQRFHLFLPAARFTDDPEYAALLGDEQIFVQGVIDLCFETDDGRLVLCDYKTDRLPRGKAEAEALLRERHGSQLAYYAEACRALFGRSPDRVCLYALAMGEAVELPV
ncbi:MAG: helicase-exonuclease AddAB subunit AddA [Clostridia bacterium]|nr:helicase-exonuclease AddAB subunit AddA [Clostridia bacterium]